MVLKIECKLAEVISPYIEDPLLTGLCWIKFRSSKNSLGSVLNLDCQELEIKNGLSLSQWHQRKCNDK